MMKFNMKTMGRMLAAVVFASGLMLASTGCSEKKSCTGCDKQQAAVKCAGDCSKDCAKSCAHAQAAKKCPAGCTKPCCKTS